jgi:DNA-binding NtrC family response regulator
MKRRILLAEAEQRASDRIQSFLEADPLIQVDVVDGATAALEALAETHYSVLLADLSLPGLKGMDLLQEIQQRHIPVTVIVMAEHGSIDQAVLAMRHGAGDFLAKPIDLDHLRLMLQRILRERQLCDEVAYLRDELQDLDCFHNIISKSPRMRAVFELISSVARTNTTVLIEGETGTGKEQVARAIHGASHLRTGRLVAVNCAAVPEHLLESELFGHEKGAFTTAVSQRHGRFELAHRGSIFLDEVGDIPPAMQAKLLRVLQERRFERVGGTDSIEVDVRVIAATNRSLLRLVQDQQFREDLYYRLNVVKIDLPPLRERPEDIPLLAVHFAEKYARPDETPKQVAPEAMEALLAYHWPGNIRELENAIERACVISLGGAIGPENLPPQVLQREPARAPISIDLNLSLPETLRRIHAEIEREYIRKALEQSRGNVSRCAQICGLSRRSLTTKLAIYQIDKSLYKDVLNAASVDA